MNESDDRTYSSPDTTYGGGGHQNQTSTIIMRMNKSNSSCDTAGNFGGGNENNEYQDDGDSRSPSIAAQKIIQKSNSSELSILKHKLKEMRDKH